MSNISPVDPVIQNFMVQLEAIGVTNEDDKYPQISAVGTNGDFVVTFVGEVSSYSYSVFSQKFNANGTPMGDIQRLIDVETYLSNGLAPQVASVGQNGEFVITFVSTEESTFPMSIGDTSIYVQKFNADGTKQGNYVVIEPADMTQGYDFNPQVTEVGNTGEFVVTFQGENATGSTSIFAQKFNADGTTHGTMVQMGSTGTTYATQIEPHIASLGASGEYVIAFDATATSGRSHVYVQQFNADGTAQGALTELVGSTWFRAKNFDAQVASVGDNGEYVVVFDGTDNGAPHSVYVQKFNADGTMQGSAVRLDGFSSNSSVAINPQITEVGTTGEFVVTFESEGSIFVQKFMADGTTSGAMVQLDGETTGTGFDQMPQIAGLGSSGDYVVVFRGHDADGDFSVFVQKFNADGTTQGDLQTIEPNGVTDGEDYAPQVTAIGDNGEFAITFYGTDSDGDLSVFVQTFDQFGNPNHNSVPNAEDDSLAAAGGASVTIAASTLLANDSDADGDALSVISVTSGTGGTALLNADGTITFTADAGFSGAADFTYEISDGKGGTDTATVTVNVNSAPVAENDSLSTPAGEAITVTAQTLLANDSDADGDALTITSVTSGNGGTAQLNTDGTITFTPTAGFNGQADFTYTISDGKGETASASVIVDVVNNAPTAENDSLSVRANAATVINSADLLANDSDADGDALTITSVTSGNGGTAQLNADGTITFTPTSGFAGAANFTYTIRDGRGGSSSATVALNVIAPNGIVNGTAAADFIDPSYVDAQFESVTNGNDVIVGLAGNDTIYAYDGDDQVYGGDDNDIIAGMDGGDLVYGGNGNDRLYGGNGVDRMYGDAGDDFLRGGNDLDVLYGGLGNDVAYGEAGNDYLIGQDGVDRLFGGDGIDRIYGGNDNDYIYGGAGNDLAYGDAGHDYILGQDGIDRLYGGAGNDTMRGGNQNDYVFGGAGNDVLYGEADHDAIYGEAGVDRLFGGVGNDTIFGGDQNDYLYGEAGADRLFGGNDTDFIYGGADNDSIYGDAGNDRLYGDAGNDTIFGGAGNDWFYGGAGADTFVFRPGEGSNAIFDFEDGVDRIVLSGIDPNDVTISSWQGKALLITGAGEQVYMPNLDAADFTHDDFLIA